jgi:hypothetical protein
MCCIPKIYGIVLVPLLHRADPNSMAVEVTRSDLYSDEDVKPFSAVKLFYLAKEGVSVPPRAPAAL